MINKAKQLVIRLHEELIYHEQIDHYLKNLEATLWGLEEQAGMPINTGQEDQEAFADQMNKCRLKIKASQDLLTAHESKIKHTIESALK